MNLREVLRQTFSAIRAHKMRSFLTMFGIVWGIASVILLVGLGKGFSRDQKTRMKSLGTDIVIIWGGRTSAQAGGFAAGRPIRLSINDVRQIQAECYLIKSISPEIHHSVPEVSQYNSANLAVRGVWPIYQDFRSLHIGEGRLMTGEDEDGSRRVAVLGYEARQQLFNGQPAVDQTILMKGYPYAVIGVLQKKKQNSDYGSGKDDTQIFVPYSAMARDFPPIEKPGSEESGRVRGWLNNIVFEVSDPEQHEQTVEQLRQTMARIHHFDPKDKDALFIWDTMEGAKLMQKIFDVMTVFFAAVAIMTLCLGGIGVMNIMLVSVSERTREIGVRKALGATRGDILRQFFAESATLTLLSGTVGLLCGVGICMVMGELPLPDFLPHPIISLVAVGGSLLTLSLITVTAGMYPAHRAAELTPVECLRYE